MNRETKFAAIEDESTLKIKAIWKTYRIPIVLAVLVGFGFLFAYQYWLNEKKTAGEQASDLYSILQEQAPDSKAAEDAYRELSTRFENNIYNTFGTLLMAKHAVESKETQQAIYYLQKALDNESEPILKHIIRLRMASILLYNGSPQKGIDLLKPFVGDDVENKFYYRYQELIGDAYLQLGNKEDAILAYDAVLELLPPSSPLSTLVSLKHPDNIDIK